MAHGRGPNKGKMKDPLDWRDMDDIPPSIVRAQRRIKESLTGTGLKDFVFFASPLIQDVCDNLQEEFPALEHLRMSVAKAARQLDDMNWDRFVELPVLRQHTMDYEVHTALFSKIEPTWKTLLTTPKGATTPCVWLHIGTQPTSAPLGDLLDKMGWFGVNIGPQTPPPHLREKVDHVQLDPLQDKDDIEFKMLTHKKGGLCPKPKFFKLAFIKLLFSPDDPVLDSSDEEDNGEEGGKEAAMGTIPEEAPEASAPPGGPADPSSPSKPPEKKGLHDLGTEAMGYGKLGVTRGMHVRRRLRALRNVLNVALSRLENEGTLLITWPALPFHPMLFFLTHYLRGLFMRVHLITPDSTKSWEVYILCASFKRSDKDNPGSGGGSELKSFLDGAYRANCLDDVLLWTLTQEAEKEEAEGQKGTLALGYQELWTVFANKFEALAYDLSSEVIEAPPPPRPKRPESAAQAQQQGGAQARPLAGGAQAGQQQQQQQQQQALGQAKAGAALGQAKAGAAKGGGAATGGGRPQRGGSVVAGGAKGSGSGGGGREAASASSAAASRRSSSKTSSPSSSPSKQARGSRTAGGKGSGKGGGQGGGGGQAEGGGGEGEQRIEEAPEEEIDLHQTEASLEAKQNRKAKEESRKMNLTEKAVAAGVSKEDYEKKTAEGLRAGVEKWKVMDNSGIQRFVPKEKLFVPGGAQKGNKDKDKRKKLLAASGPIQIRRSYPTLSCSLGASAGAAYKGFPDREAFVASFPLLAHALDCTEQHDRRWHRRRELLGTSVIAGTANSPVKFSEDLLLSPPSPPSRPPSGAPSKPGSPQEGGKRAKSMPSLPRFKRMVPPPLLPLWSEARGGGPARPG